MNLKVIRKEFTDKSTIGELFVDGKFECYTLEDKVRPIKIKHQTAIPAGIYEVIINNSERFHRQMPLLLNVPNFDGIRIHSGNTDKDTSGCILVGQTKSKDFIGNSRYTFTNLFAKMQAAIKNERIFIEIIEKKDNLQQNIEKVNLAEPVELIYNIEDASLFGKVGNKEFKIKAFSGFRGGSTTYKYSQAQDPLLTHIKTNHLKNQHGGPLPVGKYKIHCPKKWDHLGLASLLEPYKSNHMLGRGGFFIHGRGHHGSDGCIVPIEQFRELMNALASFKEEIVGTLTVEGYSFKYHYHKDSINWILPKSWAVPNANIIMKPDVLYINKPRYERYYSSHEGMILNMRRTQKK